MSELKPSCENCVHSIVCTEADKFAYSFRIIHKLATMHSFFEGQDVGILGLSLHQAVASICKHYANLAGK